MLRTAICLTSFFIFTLPAASANQLPLTKPAVQQQIAGISIPFVTNKGQTDSQVKFYAQTLGGSVFVTNKGEIVYALPQAGGTQSVALRETFVGGIHSVRGENSSNVVVSDFRGNDTSRWQTKSPTYEQIGLTGKQVTLKLKAQGRNVEKFFHIKAGGDSKDIQVKLSGAQTLQVNDRGELEASTELGTATFTKPVAYQDIAGQRHAVPVAYVVQGLSYGFKVGDYDRTHELVIDPLLASTFLGGSGNDSAEDIALDRMGNVFVTGTTYSMDFPTSPHAYNGAYNGGSSDVFIAKLNSDLTQLMAATYLGASGDDTATGITIDARGMVYVTGYTSSTNFPTTRGAFDRSFNSIGSYRDAFVSKLDNNLGRLSASTYLGSNYGDEAYDIFMAPDGSVIVTGRTYSDFFPVTASAYDTTLSGTSTDSFVTRLDNKLSTLLASTLLGGEGYDWAYAGAVDGGGNIYITGWTDSSDFPTTPGAYDPSFGLRTDVFVSKFNFNLTTLSASTYLGGIDLEEGHGIAVDGTGNVYVTGFTSSTDFPTTAGAYDTTLGNFATNAFVSKLNNGLTALSASTFLGGSTDDEGYGLALDSGGNVYVSGRTQSADFPTTTSAYDTSYNGSWDVFLSKLNNGLSSLLASTYLGGSVDDVTYNLVLDGNSNVYTAGKTSSSNFPTTPGAYDTTLGYADAFVSKLGSGL
ncbi:MAG: SBBP repeat-containing protein [Gallionellaceae bacterium]|nr:SBBP repeat-containing protein [Gallionellaceae bacterium]